LRDPRIRLEIGGTLYEARAVRVRDEAGGDAAARGLLRKYIGIEAEHAHSLDGPPAEGDDRAEVWTFRVEPAEGASS
ncbi:MAG: hypothetical protein JRH10_21725, partial [Deltaproteobacteria bacterium]|nr:hypothetical protein [Deltaproteobacteria bacterium]